MSEELFPADERAIFPYQIEGPFSYALPIPGTAQVRFADPLKVDNRLIQFSFGEINKWMQESGRLESDIAPPDSVRAAADEKLVPAIRFAFELPEFNPENGHGATADYCLWLFDSFLAWRDQKKMTGEDQQTSSAPTESGHPEGSSPTPATTDCC